MSEEAVPAFFQEQAQRVQNEMDTAKRRLVRLTRERDGLEAGRVDPEQYRAASRDLTGLISDYHRRPVRLRPHSTCAQWSLVVSGCAIEVDEHSCGAAGFGAAPGG